MTMLIKSALHRVAEWKTTDGVIAGLESVAREPKDLLRVLTYHRVDWPDAQPHLYPGIISATPDDFRAQMEWLSEHYNAIAHDQLVSAIECGTELPPRSIMVTFDDV